MDIAAQIQLSSTTHQTYEKNIKKILDFVSVIGEGGAFQTKHGCRMLQKDLGSSDEDVIRVLFGINFIHIPPKMKKSRKLKLIFRKDNLYFVAFTLDGILYECAGLGFTLATTKAAVILDFGTSYGELTSYDKNRRRKDRKSFLYEVGKSVIIKAVECIMQDPDPSKSADVARSLMVLAIHFAEGLCFRTIRDFISANYLAQTTATLGQLSVLINNWSQLSKVLCLATEEEVQTLLRNRDERMAMEERETEDENRVREEGERKALEEMTSEEKKEVERAESILYALDHLQILHIVE